MRRRSSASRFATGSHASTGAAIEYLERIGMPAAAGHEAQLTHAGMEGLASVQGLRLIGTSPTKVGVLSFVLDGVRTEDVGRFLDSEGIAVRAGHHCAQPAMRHFHLESTVRASLGVYNTFDEVERLVSAVRRAARAARIHAT
jgi:cysteine desulfurase/selenocysteine lyase